MFKLVFNYDKRGRGDLVLTNDTGHTFGLWKCRCGSVNKAGDLVKATPTRKYRIWQKTENTAEIGMVVTPGKGWKVHMWSMYSKDKMRYEGICIHPDGNKPGSLGCIVTVTGDSLDLRTKIDELITRQTDIYVEVGRLK